MDGGSSKATPPPQPAPAKAPLALTDLQRAKFDLKVKKERLERMTKSQLMETAVRAMAFPS